MTIEINDGSTWRIANRIYVNDASTWRPIKQIYVNDAGTWRTVYTNEFTFNLTAGINTDGINFSFEGYDQGTGLGSVSNSTLPDGKTLIRWTRTSVSGSDVFGIAISGFSSDPGQSYFTDIDVVNSTGTDNRTALSATYSYSTGTAGWSWSNSPALIHFNSGGPAFNGQIIRF